MSPTYVFISGANLGIGLGLLRRFLALDDHIVIAGNRSPEHPSSQALHEIARGKGSKLIVTKVNASVDGDAASAVNKLEQEHKIDHLDIVIANAGISYVWPAVSHAKLDDFKAHMEFNVYGVIALYQATRPLLQKSSREPIFAAMGSAAGCIA